MKRLVLCYFSPTGGTKKICDIFKKPFASECHEIDMLLDKEFYNFTFIQDDLVIVAIPSYGGRVPSVLIPKLKMMKGNHAKAIMLCAYGNRAIDDTLLELKNTLKMANFDVVGAVSAVAKHSLFPLIASDRPNDSDRLELQNFAKEINNCLLNGRLKEVEVPGNYPYREFHGTPFKPMAHELCNGCGRCAEECPSHAIDFSDLKSVNANLCISCMHCVNICPMHARNIDKNLQNSKYPNMLERCSEKQPNQLFLTLNK